MTEFTLDTSGEVAEPKWERPPMLTVGRPLRWPDLSPFAQGYVKAMFAGGVLLPNGPDFLPHELPLGFSDLAPETLAAILKDCEAHEKAYPLQAHDPRRHSRGRWFWRNRAVGMWTNSGWPPLTLYLGDDGKVYLREA